MQDINVLLVDDDKEVLDLLTHYLGAAHLVVEAAESGMEALELLRHYRPEVIVADVEMPGMSGHELCRVVRDLEQDEIPFIFCSAHGSPLERILGLRVGADDFVVKSANLEELLLKIRLQLARRRRMKLMTELAENRRPSGLMSGVLGEVTVPELLQVIGLLGLKEACVRLQSTGQHAGEIYLVGDRIAHAKVEDMVGKAALRRMLEWKGGTFRVLGQASSEPDSIGETIAKCLLDGLTYLDHYRELADSGPFQVDHARLERLELDERGLQVLALVDTGRDLDAIIERSPLTDQETLDVLSELRAEGLIVRSSQPGFGRGGLARLRA